MRAAILACLASGTISSCRKGTERTLAGDRPLDNDSVIDRIKSSGKVRFGFRADARPFSFKDASGNPAGYSIELCNSVARLLTTELATAVKVEWVPVTLDNWTNEIAEHRIDLYCSAIPETLNRRKVVDYSVPVFPGGVAAVVRSDAPQVLKDILVGLVNVSAQPGARAVALDIVRGQKFAVVKGTTAEDWMRQQRKELKLDSEVITVDSYDAGIKAVIDRRADAFFGQIAILRDVTRQPRNAASITTIERMFTYEPVALAMQRNDDDFRLLVDRALSERFAAADFWATYTRWFGMPEVTDVVFYLWNTLPK
jgi:polar amino acid transport system substrate-binding protein